MTIEEITKERDEALERSGKSWNLARDRGSEIVTLRAALRTIREDRDKALQRIQELERDTEAAAHAFARIRALCGMSESEPLPAESGVGRLRLRIQGLEYELKASRSWQDEHLRILSVSDGHFKESLAKVRHLWPESDTPGIEGICTKLQELETASVAAQDRIRELEVELSSVRVCFSEASHSAGPTSVHVERLKADMHEIFMACNLEPPTEGARQPELANWIRKQTEELSALRPRAELCCELANALESAVGHAKRFPNCSGGYWNDPNANAVAKLAEPILRKYRALESAPAPSSAAERIKESEKRTNKLFLDMSERLETALSERDKALERVSKLEEYNQFVDSEVARLIPLEYGRATNPIHTATAAFKEAAEERERLKALLETANKDSAEDTEAVRECCKRAGLPAIAYEGSSHGVPNVVEMAESLMHRCEKYRSDREGLIEAVDDMLEAFSHSSCDCAEEPEGTDCEFCVHRCNSRKEAEAALAKAKEITGSPETQPMQYCKAGRDGECTWPECPQNRENEPEKSGHTCPLPMHEDEE